MRRESTSVRRRPKRKFGNTGIAIRLRSQAQHRLDWSEVDRFSRIRNSGPLVATLRPFSKLFFSDKFAQHCGHTSRMCGIASSEQSIHHVGGRCITVFCPDKVDHGIGQSLFFAIGLSQKRLKNSDGLPKLCPLALQGVSLVIKRFEFLCSAFKRPLICGCHIGPSNNQQYRRLQ